MNARPAEIISTQSNLRERLPTYSRSDASLLREIFSHARRWEIKGSSSSFWFELRRALPQIATERVSIVIGGRIGELDLTSTKLESIGELDWSDYLGSARLTAWTLVHRRAMTRLARVFESVLLPQALLHTQATTASDLLAVGFVLGDESGISDSGVLQIDPALLRNLLTRPHETIVERAGINRFRELDAALKLRARGPELKLDLLRSLECGDVIVLGDRRTAFTQLHLAASTDERRGWSASWNEGRVHIEALASSTLDDSWSKAMNETLDEIPPADTETQTTTVDPLAELPMRIDFTLGETLVPLGKLSAFEPGYVFDLANDLENARVGIRANGKSIGHGRLVAIGDTLGVQLEGWEVDGLQ